MTSTVVSVPDENDREKSQGVPPFARTIPSPFAPSRSSALDLASALLTTNSNQSTKISEQLVVMYYLLELSSLVLDNNSNSTIK